MTHPTELSIVQRGAGSCSLDAAAPAEPHLLGTGSPVVRRTGDPTNFPVAVNAVLMGSAANGVSSRDTRAAALCGTEPCPRPERAASTAAAGLSGNPLHPHASPSLPLADWVERRALSLPGRLGLVFSSRALPPEGARDDHHIRDERRARDVLYGRRSGTVEASR